jgi:hypothetical protein
MKKIIALIFIVVSSKYGIAQNSFVNFDFEVDGEKRPYTNAVVKFIQNSDTLIVNVKDAKLLIPSSVVKERVTAIFYIDKYVLKFDSIPITLNNMSPKWTIGVDEKPFDKKKLWMVKSWRKVQIVYYLHNADGRIFTVDNYKISRVISK